MGVVQGIAAAARQLEDEGRDIVRLEVGEPDFATPPHVVQAGVRAMLDGHTRYVAPEGILPLRGAIAARLRAQGHDVTAERVLVTSGAKPMLLYALQALVRDGDEVLVPDPGYPGYAAAVALARGVAVPYTVVAADGAFRLDVAAIEAQLTTRTRVLVLNSPHNPTGGVAGDAELDALAELAQRRDLWIVSDEVYAAIVHDGPAPAGIGTRPGMAARTVTVDSVSKTWAMTGWRLGWGVVPGSLVARVRALVADSATCAPAFVQQAGIAALTGPQDAVHAMVAAYRARRDEAVAALATAGIATHVPAGAFYVFPALASRRGSAWMTERLLRRHGLACAPGVAFGARGEGRLRLSFAAPAERVAEGIRRLARFADELRPA